VVDTALVDPKRPTSFAPQSLGKHIVPALASFALAVLGLTVAPSAAFAGPPDLSAIVVSQSLPGFVVSPAGSATNGPINQSNLSDFGPSASGLEPSLANGTASGYIRAWVQQPPNGDGVLIIALWTSHPNGTNEVMAGVSAGSLQAGATTFDVPGIPGAHGYSVQESGNQNYSVAFVKGDTAFIVQVVNGAGDLTSDDAITLATQQFDAAPGSTSASSSDPLLRISYDLGEVAFFIILAIVVVFFVQRARSKRSGTTVTPSPESASFAAASSPQSAEVATVMGATERPNPVGPYRASTAVALAEPLHASSAPTRVEEAGWKTDPADPTHVVYWDGTEFLTHKHWDGFDWVDY
jgi:hypothetical protein